MTPQFSSMYTFLFVSPYRRANTSSSLYFCFIPQCISVLSLVVFLFYSLLYFCFIFKKWLKICPYRNKQVWWDFATFMTLATLAEITHLNLRTCSVVICIFSEVVCLFKWPANLRNKDLLSRLHKILFNVMLYLNYATSN